MNERPLWSTPVTYGAVGATQSADLLRYPPAGYRAVERRARIGHGALRWDFAWPETLSWGIMVRSGFRVDVIESPAEVVENSYVAVSFDEAGAPVPAAEATGERVFSSSGRELVRPGDTAVLSLSGWRLLGVREPVRVIYLVDEPRRKGFAYGTLAGHPLRGEELFVVERHDDDSVWMVVRYFARPANRWWWALYPLVRLGQAVMLRRYLRSLAVPLASA